MNSVFNHCFFSTSAAAGTFKVKSGTYTGTGAALAITGLGFQPKLLIIKADGNAASDDPVIAWSGMSNLAGSGPAAAVISTNAVPATGIVTSYDADGFTLANNALVNTNTVTYYYVAIGGETSTDIATGFYLGNGVDGATPISGLTFQPSVVFIRRRNLTTSYVSLKISSMAGDSSYMLGNAAAMNTNNIQAINATSVEIGTAQSVNVAGAGYDWVCFTAPSGYGAFGSYTGNGIDNSDLVSGLTFQPDWVLVKGNTTQEAVMYGTANVGDDSSRLVNSSQNFANRIQAINADGFEVGSAPDVNTVGIVYHYIALKST